MLEPGALAEFRRNVERLDNRAVFEVPEIFGRLMGEGTGKEADSRQQLTANS